MKNVQPRAVIAITFLLVSAAVASGQASPKQESTKPAAAISDNSLVVVNEAGQQSKLKAADLAKLKRITVKASDHGKESTFDGVALVDVLTMAGVEFGEKLRGKRLASYLLVEAADKYRVVFALAELDPGFTDKVIILADRRDGKALDETAGVWQIVVPDEKRPSRWVRQVVSLKILIASN